MILTVLLVLIGGTLWLIGAGGCEDYDLHTSCGGWPGGVSGIVLSVAAGLIVVLGQRAIRRHRKR